ncbi:hypothetical protein R1S95_001415 [Listeria monocytogenes]|nr:hypothetical protein [Listeria monocytogenes]
MFKQEKHNFQYIVYSKKYWALTLLTVILSIFLTITNSTNGRGLTLNAYKQIFDSFRQLFWVISVFVITDLVSTDYHSKTLKNVVSKSNSRASYILSKIGISTLFSLFLLLVHFLTMFLLINLASSGIPFNFYKIPWFILGIFLSLLFFASFLSFTMVISENEVITMGVAIGLVLLSMLAEAPSISFSQYLPTMLVVTLEEIAHSNFLLSISVLAGYLVLAFLSIFATIKMFNKKDIFI